MEEAKLNLISFKKSDVSEIAESLGMEIAKDGAIIVNEKPATCHACGDKLRIDNLGSIMPSSLELYCDDLTCFAKYVAKLTSETTE